MEVNKNVDDYNSNILKLLHKNSGEGEYSIDELADFISSRIDGVFDRHYMRVRLFDLCKKGRIANPRMKTYSTPSPNPELILQIDSLWDEFVQNARIYKSEGTLITDIKSGFWEITDVNDTMERAVLYLSKKEDTQSAQISFEHFSNSMNRINCCGGRMERPDRRDSHRSAYCELLPCLSIDEEGFTVVNLLPNEPLEPNFHEEYVGKWNVRRRRPIFNFDFEPSFQDSTEGIIQIQKRHLRHEDLVDFVWNEVLGDRFDKIEGQYDLLCKNREYKQIIWEMKTIELNDFKDQKRQVLKAVSQLFYYDFQTGNGGMYPLIACFERKISDELIEFLAMCNIFCCWFYRNRLTFSDILPIPNGILPTD